ncbi:MAG: tRNA 2-thiouridine(34) synthase MnmA [Bacilli bacterium]|nr:tRNA 2-thiouridine(34) synthase MnmA [Bacilli bacterium]
MEKKPRVVVGLSGGVDSAVSVIKLQEAGYEVEGMFMRNWDSSLNNDILGNPHTMDDVCPQEVDYMDALDTAKSLGIKLHRIDFVDEYWSKVFEYFLSEYKKFRTPNPDILCNKEIKFRCFLDKAMEMGFDYIAMGHYARITHENGKTIVYKGFDKNKDQTYFLSQLSLEQLEKALFPIGDITKKEVREIALAHNLKIAKKKDSTGVCFIGERNFKKFLENYLPAQPGDMELLDGTKVGRHDGLMYYTIGQRHGLALGGEGEAWYVLGKDVSRNVLLVGRGSDQEYLYSNRCLVSGINWIGEEFNHDPNNYLDIAVKFRYRSNDVKCRIHYISDDVIEIFYPDKFKSVTPGQAAVFYDGERLLGGATIDEVFMDDMKRRY